MTIDELIQEINLRFVSGNCVPVSRAYINREEWEDLRDALIRNTEGAMALQRAIAAMRDGR